LRNIILYALEQILFKIVEFDISMTCSAYRTSKRRMYILVLVRKPTGRRTLEIPLLPFGSESFVIPPAAQECNS
jgi:hypothetical protein